MSSFSKILHEKLKKQDIPMEDAVAETLSPSANSGLGVDLLRWLNSSPLSQKHYYKVEESSYSIYKKDPKVIAAQRLEREKSELNEFLNLFSTDKDKASVRFFYAQGARSFMSMRAEDLKRDYKKLALKLHPDRHFNEIPSVQKQSQEDFRVLSESYDTLRIFLSLRK